MEFLIGFEFEFGWLPETNNEKPKKSKYIPKTDYFNNYIFVEVRQSLKSFLGKNYKFISEIMDDPSLSFSKNFRQGHFGVEIVTKPMEETTAIAVFREIMTWMKQHPSVMTNHTCGLHVNISCADKNINKRLDYFSILQNTPQDEILEKFNRTKNNYCQSTNTKKFSLEIGTTKTKPRTLDFWLSKTHQHSISVTTYAYASLKYDVDKKKDRIIFNDAKHAEEIIKTAFLSALFYVDKNISIVEKRSPSKKRYFEFRMIGNTDYEHKRAEILKCITQFKRALRKSVLP